MSPCCFCYYNSSSYFWMFPLVPAPEKPVVDVDTVITTHNSISFYWSLPPGTTASEVSWTLADSRAGGTVDSTERGSSGMITGNSYTITDLSSRTSYEITVSIFHPAGNTSINFTRSTTGMCANKFYE